MILISMEVDKYQAPYPTMPSFRNEHDHAAL
jgi:hypothetical protein